VEKTLKKTASTATFWTNGPCRFGQLFWEWCDMIIQHF